MGQKIGEKWKFNEQFQLLNNINNEIIHGLKKLREEEYNPLFECSLRALEYCKERIELAQLAFGGKLSVIFGPNESKKHVIGKHYLINYLNPIARIPWEVSLAKYKPDYIIKIKEEWGFLEIETDSYNIEKDIKGVIRLINQFNNIKHKINYIQMYLDEIKKQLIKGIKPHLYIGIFEEPNEIIKKFISYHSDKLNCNVFLINIENGNVSKVI